MVIDECFIGDVEEVLERLLDDDELQDSVRVYMEEGSEGRIMVDGWYIRIPLLKIRIHSFIYELWNEDCHSYECDFSGNMIYRSDSAFDNYCYFEQGSVLSTLRNWFRNEFTVEQLESFKCEIVVDDKELLSLEDGAVLTA